MTRLFKRGASLTLAKANSTSTDPTERFAFLAAGNAITIENLRVTFSIEKHLSSEPNKCDCKVYNLAETTRAEFQAKPVQVHLAAGYDGALERLFGGDLRWSQTKREGADIVTSMQLADGDRNVRHGRVSKSYKPGTDARTVISDTAKSMGLKMPTSIADAKELVTQFVTGTSVQGPAAKELTRVLKPHGMDWSIQDGQLQILRPTDVRADQAIVISQDGGMVGIPELATPTENGKAPVLTVVTLLHPGIKPGGLIQVVSERINGIFKVSRVVHTGDTEGAEWFSTVEASEVTGARVVA